MRNVIEGYIKTCEELIARHMLIEDPEERERAVNAQTLMMEDFKAYLEDMEV